MPPFIFADLIDMLQGQADIVQAAEQVAFSEGVDVEVEAVAAGCGYALVGEIDGKLYAFVGVDFRH